MPDPGRPNVFVYDDFRKFLRDSYTFQKKQNAEFSYRYFAKEAGYTSPNFLKLVIDGKRNLTPESAQRCAEVFKLRKREMEFFTNLVLFNQARDDDARNRMYKSMSRNRRYGEIRKIEKDQFKFYSRWYYSAIRELVDHPAFQEDPEWIASALPFKIQPRQAKAALTFLVKLKFLERDSQGRLRQTNRTIATAPEVNSLAIKNFHRQMIKLAAESLDCIPGQFRDVTAVTLGFPRELMPQLKEKIALFREELLKTIGSSGKKSEQIYQLNIQLFPLSEVKEGKPT